VNPDVDLLSPGMLCETASGAVPVAPHVAAARPDEVTRPVDAPVAREHGLSGRLLLGTDLRLETRVGRGASAMVYRATRARGGPPVAVKVLHSRSKESVRQRFLREIEILRQIDSPRVVKVAGKGVLPDGRPWYAMEYIDGQSLARILSTQGGSDPATVIEWLRDTCRGLAAIHAAGWVHRDVKPANLVVVQMGDRDAVKIVDLGIAERIHAQPELLSGTPEYIAPEQAEFRPVDVRSDVYALGCCAYELLTGRRLVQGASAVAKINAHIEGVRPHWPLGCRVPFALRRLVERCLARRPEARPPNMHAVEAELERVADAMVHGSSHRVAPPRRPACRAVTELDLGWPNTAANEAPPSPEPDAPVWRLGRSWSSLASTLLSVLSPGPAKEAAPAETVGHHRRTRPPR
jgi:serine/threonine protein kinase